MRIEPFNNQPGFKSKSVIGTVQSTDNRKSSAAQTCLLLSLAGLAAIGGGALLKKKRFSTMTYEQALKKAGVEIQDGIAKLKTGENYTGKIERYKTKNEKENVEFLDGKIKEKIYHSANGNELSGYFYKDGKLKISVSPSTGSDEKFFSYREYQNDMSVAIGDGKINRGESVFEWARNIIKSK